MKIKKSYFKNAYLLIIVSVLIVLSCTKQETEPKYPVFGIDKIKDIQLIEGRGDTFLNWIEKDIKDAVVLYVSEQNPLNTYAAEKLGLIKNIYWVLPNAYFTNIPLAGKKIKKFLNEAGGFNENEINKMRMVSGCLNGILSGIAVDICSPRTLQLMEMPVVMTIDAVFFRVYAEGQRKSKLSVMKHFFDEMTFRKLRVVHMDISYGTEGGESKTMHRFIAEELYEGISNPDIFQADTPPELWRQRDMAENMLSGGEDTKVIEYLEGPLKQFPEDIPLRMLNATAMVRAGKDDESFNELEKICKKDSHYCYGFVDLGNILIDEKRNVIAGEFYKRAAESLPDDPYVMQQYRDYLKKSGRTE